MGRGVGIASACASATVVNAIAAGKGAAFGVDLRVQARVRLTKGGKISGRILGQRKESPRLIEICVRRVLENLGMKKYGAVVETTSEIPIAVGLSSSSAAANAVVLATFAACDQRPKPEQVLEIGIESAFEAGVTVTGALDDAAASFYGGGVITDNLKRKILKRFKVDPRLVVVVHVPPVKFYTSKVSPEDLRHIYRAVQSVHRMALRGEIWKSLTINGLLYSTALGHDPMIAIEAISKGAVAAGLTGTGSATVAVAEPDKVVDIVKAWRAWRGRILITKPAIEGARVEGV
ncbi:MAG: shikimate kinase [Candidatus Hadarchaeum sp.]|uniref:shikimate kinase n=1 Tax=Candidatus Hadarchaeum sp. TaxID=2883567 RepID=UPI00317C0211